MIFVFAVVVHFPKLKRVKVSNYLRSRTKLFLNSSFKCENLDVFTSTDDT